jgi:TatD DNase family protein
VIDAHNHLHDARLAPQRERIMETLAPLGLECAVVNGTRESDWPAVSALATEHSWVRPSYGLHPWHIRERSAHSLYTLAALLDADPAAAVGEIGLDRWIEGHDLADQREVFRAQLALAAARDRAVTIHCLRAWGPLWEILRREPLPARGFLLHAYGGPWEMTRGFLDRGGYFSFNAYFLHERKAAQRDVFHRLPANRLLVETDAPDLAPPPERNAHPLSDAEGRAINHPANLSLAYRALAEIRNVPLETLVAQVRENFGRLFGQRDARFCPCVASLNR